ncbi:tyrosine-type recombinase/integrase [Streptodolium elevatio]|uniref:Tyrosine-type recombinase/integrase n=1 Tax=Streptodolium elevatio TaxID=3157996 RepID=A0ABV3DUX8_9ACTN
MNVERRRVDPAHLEVPRVGRVVACEGPLPWALLDGAGAAHGGVEEFLRQLVARDCAASSVRSYAMALLRWLRFLWVLEVAWDRPGRGDVRDFVLWMRSAVPSRPVRGGGAGGLNARTGKPYLGGVFAPSTINHNLAVVSEFYDHHIARGTGPLVNPVPARASERGGRAFEHHNPLEPFRPGRRAAFRQKVPATAPRAMPDELFDELFAAMSSDRDRALLAFYVSCGARPAELLGLHGARVDVGEQLVGVVRKGTRELQWLPASPDAFVWLLLYRTGLPEELAGPDQPVWWTLRKPYRPLGYDALRAVLRRANARLGTNWTVHDLRHTFAVRMAADPNVPLTTLQTLLGHAWLTTTQRYLNPRMEQVLQQARAHAAQAAEPRPAVPRAAVGYEDEDLRELFGRRLGPSW